MRLFGGSKAALPSQRPLTPVLQQDERGIATLPLDILADILIDALPSPASTSGHSEDDALLLVRRTAHLSRLRTVCRAWRELLRGPFWRDIGVRETKRLEGLALSAKKNKDDAQSVRRLLYLDTKRTREDDCAVKESLKTLFKACPNLEVLCLIGAEVQVDLTSLVLQDTLLLDDISFYRVAFPPTALSRRPRLQSLRHLTVEGCLFVQSAEKHLFASLPTSSLDLRCLHNTHYSLSSQEKTSLLNPLSGLSSRQSHTLSGFLASPSLSSTLTALSLALEAKPSSIDTPVLASLRTSPLETLHLDLASPLPGGITWHQEHPELLLYARTVRAHPRNSDALVLLKDLVALFQRDAETGGGGGQEGRVFPYLRKVVLPFSWGESAVFQEYFDPELPYALAKLKSAVEARGAILEVETAKQASVWGKARFAWTE
ncbi:hypothetical protein JCM10213_002380 [Rhodosporidiobolus nylandii]